MEVRQGFKQTEVGVIPEDWDTDSMLRVSRQIMDYRGRTPKKLGMDWGGGDIPALSAGNVKMGFVDFNAECYFASETLYSRWMTRGDVAKDDILFTTEAPLGNVALVPDDRKYILSQRTILLQICQERVSSRFLFQTLLSDGFQRMLADYSSGSTAKGIQRKKFEQLCVAMPPLPEQRAIAAALSDVDALLAGLDRLIAKKRDLKQATMQQLLTGRTRLPGFSGEWEEKRLGEVAEIVMGQSPSSTNYNVKGEGLPLIQGNADIANRQTIKRIFTTEITKRGKKGDTLLTVRAPVGEVSRAPFDVCLGRGVCAIRFPNDFLYHYLIFLEPNWGKHSKGSTFDSVNSADVNVVEIRVPADESEQTAIAAALADMDAEISALVARRDKTRALKQAMMQELLTGRTRLV
jgi:type I restriction enzyme S subunit